MLHGPAGCGGPSLQNLLGRVRDPDEGAILLDGYNLRGYALADVHRAVALVDHDGRVLPDSSGEADTRLLILDEPEAQLGPEAADSLIADVIAAAHRTGTGVLLITQRPIATDRIDRVIELRDGRICSDIYYDRAAPATTSL